MPSGRSRWNRLNRQELVPPFLPIATECEVGTAQEYGAIVQSCVANLLERAGLDRGPIAKLLFLDREIQRMSDIENGGESPGDDTAGADADPEDDLVGSNFDLLTGDLHLCCLFEERALTYDQGHCPS